MLMVRERRAAVVVQGSVIRAAYANLRKTFTKIRSYRNIFIFLIAYWLYIGGLFTVIFMAVNFGQRLGFEDKDLVTALMITNYVGFPATLLFGLMAHRFGTRRAIYVGLAVYIAVVCWAVFLKDVRQFYAMSITIGLVQGGVQSISRSLYAALIPKDLSGEFFGFYNMLTKFAHVLGPILVGIAATLSDEPKWVLLTLMPLFIGGGMLLGVVREKQATRVT
jgi:UMF1 family MFS transporter